MPLKKQHWTRLRRFRRRRKHFDGSSPLARAVIQILDEHHAGFEAILASMEAGTSMPPIGQVQMPRPIGTNVKTMRRQEWMQKVPRLQFWQNEPSLVPVVKKLFDEQTLTEAELAQVKEYVQSWITWLALIPDDVEYVALMEEIAVASQRHLMSKTIDRLLEHDIDPF